MTLPVIALAVLLVMFLAGLLVGAIFFPVSAYLEARRGNTLEAAGSSGMTLIMVLLLVIFVSLVATELSIGPEWLHWPEETQ